MTNPNHSAPDVEPLLPCPHCGGKAELLNMSGDYAVRCRNKVRTCSSRCCYPDADDARAAWNRRVIPARITEAQAREAFQKWWAANDGTYVDAYLAGLRHAGLLIEDKP